MRLGTVSHLLIGLVWRVWCYHQHRFVGDHVDGGGGGGGDIKHGAYLCNRCHGQQHPIDSHRIGWDFLRTARTPTHTHTHRQAPASSEWLRQKQSKTIINRKQYSMLDERRFPSFALALGMQRQQQQHRRRRRHKFELQK